MDVLQTHTDFYLIFIFRIFTSHLLFIFSVGVRLRTLLTYIPMVPFLPLLTTAETAFGLQGTDVWACFLCIIRWASLPSIMLFFWPFSHHNSQPVLPKHTAQFIVLLLCANTLCSGSTSTTLSLLLPHYSCSCLPTLFTLTCCRVLPISCQFISFLYPFYYFNSPVSSLSSTGPLQQWSQQWAVWGAGRPPPHLPVLLVVHHL